MTTPPRIYPDPLPDEPGDPLGFWGRVVCGALAGAVLGLALWLRGLAGDPPWVGVGVLVASISACAWGAVRHGDRFWIGLLRAWASR